MPRCYVFGSHVVHASIIARLRNWDEVGDPWAYARWKGRLQYGGQVSHPRLFKLQNSYTLFVTCFFDLLLPRFQNIFLALLLTSA